MRAAVFPERSSSGDSSRFKNDSKSCRSEFSMNTKHIPNPTVNKHGARYELVRSKEDWDRVIAVKHCLQSTEITD